MKVYVACNVCVISVNMENLQQMGVSVILPSRKNATHSRPSPYVYPPPQTPSFYTPPILPYLPKLSKNPATLSLSFSNVALPSSSLSCLPPRIMSDEIACEPRS